jgi:hypothetical protein
VDHMVRAVSLFRMIRHCCQHEPYGSAIAIPQVSASMSAAQIHTK